MFEIELLGWQLSAVQLICKDLKFATKGWVSKDDLFGDEVLRPCKLDTFKVPLSSEDS